ncbi:hypothetical protein [Botrimarina mediterranea]|uniref:Uncharacterized protein n=1 Tax=Botrimarina mediterranea TaxID=2528022 RepID=A0A518K9Q7_9BACT|nr:hypothetical protein [Botrimarina mediterranea]QDV74519.1 hypothetical protein Spa11_27230 [Botrimarina mediterranea]QDV79159.1 hypothetical protein K2D_27700 [Planctomycetes bacterium K2D]
MTQYTSSWGELTLPSPEPLEIAIEAGVFGVCREGSPRPSPGEVASIVKEHSIALTATLLEQRHVERSLTLRVHPRTGWPLSEPDRLDELQREYNDLTNQYEGLVDAYASAFGFAAADFLVQIIEPILLQSTAEPAVQKTFF